MVDKKVRQRVVSESHRWFFSTYLNHYIDFELAPFQQEMFDITENESMLHAVIMSFRNSAKSTILTMSYPLWAILGKQKKKLIVIISRTQLQAQTHLKNIRTELEENEVLKNDLGPFEDDKQWGTQGLVLPWHGARIVALSVEQSFRGLRYGKHRPDLIICDDLEDREEMKNQDMRKKMEEWFTSEVMPLGDIHTRVIVVGNLTHQDSLLCRLIEKVKNRKFTARVLRCPLIDDSGVIAWPGKFPNLDAIERFKQGLGGNESAWQREVMLKIVPDELQIVREEWIRYYDRIGKHARLLGSIVSVDPALGKPNSDCTAILSAQLYQLDDKLHIYILPNMVNARIGVTDTLRRTEEISRSLGDGHGTRIVVEGVAFQGSLVEQLRDRGLLVDSFSPKSSKAERLALTTPLLQNGQIHFPKQGAEELITQILGFGVERRDDLVDAFSMLVLHASKVGVSAEPSIMVI